MKKKHLPVLKEVVISDLGAEGNAIARVNDQVLFVPYVMPGDVVDVQLTRKRSRYMEGYVVHMHKPSPDRLSAFCEHFGHCGGCSWQHIPYDRQLLFKQKQVVDQLTRIGHLTLPSIQPILGSPEETYYRNKLEYAFSDSRWMTAEEIRSGEKFPDRNALGFHVPGKFDRVIDIHKCFLQPEPSNRIRTLVREYAAAHHLSFYNYRNQTGYLRNLIIRNSLAGEVMVLLSFHYEDQEARVALLSWLLEQVPGITSLQYAINTKQNDSLYDLDFICFHGRNHILEKMEDLTFRIGPKSFFQTNTHQVYRLYSVVRQWAEPDGGELVYDLYSGTGTIALFLAKKARKVIGIESVPEAVEDAKQNAAFNGIGNVEFVTGDILEKMNGSFFRDYGIPNLIVLDPPRAGIHQDIAHRLLQVETRCIIYVSCNPATQARDLSVLSKNYDITAVQPVDMFPHTHHVENVVKLIRKPR